MKKMALDLGTVRIGIATCDLLEVLASPYENYVRKTAEKDMSHILEIINNLNIGEIIIGLPLNMDGTEGDMALKTRQFGEKLRQQSQLDVVYHDERLTSVEAEDILINLNYSREKRKKNLDAISATVILQSYLDMKNRRYYYGNKQKSN